jgi:hypothetical protein
MKKTDQEIYNEAVTNGFTSVNCFEKAAIARLLKPSLVPPDEMEATMPQELKDKVFSYHCTNDKNGYGYAIGRNDDFGWWAVVFSHLPIIYWSEKIKVMGVNYHP